MHGVLWIIDKLHAVGICGDDRLIAALQVWRDAPSVFLPKREISRGIALLTSNEGAIR